MAKNFYSDSLQSFSKEYNNAAATGSAYRTNTANPDSPFDIEMTSNNAGYSEINGFLNGINVTDKDLDKMTPFIKGYSRIWMHKVPVFMSLKFPQETLQFKKYLETSFKRVDGIGDLSSDFVDMEGGYAAMKTSNVSIVRDDTDTVSVELYELQGQPVRMFIETWMTGTRDPRSGVCHYHGALAYNGSDASETCEYGERNHTAEFIYATLDPTHRKIEYACLFAHCFPTKSPKDHLNYETGSHDNATMSLEFKTTKYESRYINDIAAAYLALDTVKWSYLDFNPIDASSDDYMSTMTNQVQTSIDMSSSGSLNGSSY